MSHDMSGFDQTKLNQFDNDFIMVETHCPSLLPHVPVTSDGENDSEDQRELWGSMPAATQWLPQPSSPPTSSLHLQPSSPIPAPPAPLHQPTSPIPAPPLTSHGKRKAGGSQLGGVPWWKAIERTRFLRGRDAYGRGDSLSYAPATTLER